MVGSRLGGDPPQQTSRGVAAVSVQRSTRNAAPATFLAFAKCRSGIDVPELVCDVYAYAARGYIICPAAVAWVAVSVVRYAVPSCTCSGGGGGDRCRCVGLPVDGGADGCSRPENADQLPFGESTRMRRCRMSLAVRARRRRRWRPTCSARRDATVTGAADRAVRECRLFGNTFGLVPSSFRNRLIDSSVCVCERAKIQKSGIDRSKFEIDVYRHSPVRASKMRVHL